MYAGVPGLQGTDSGPQAHHGGDSEPTGGANIFFSHVVFLELSLDCWCDSPLCHWTGVHI
jgi:hypothetical protein